MVLDSIYDAEKTLFQRLDSDRTAAVAPRLEEILIRYIDTLFTPQDRVEQTRTKAAEASAAVVPLARKSKGIRLALTHAITEAREQERSVSVQQSLDHIQKALRDAS